MLVLDATGSICFEELDLTVMLDELDVTVFDEPGLALETFDGLGQAPTLFCCGCVWRLVYGLRTTIVCC